MVSHKKISAEAPLKAKLSTSHKKKSVLKGANSWLGSKKQQKIEESEESSLQPTRKPLFKINDKGEKVKKFKDGVERAFIDLDYREDEHVTFYDGFYIKREDARNIDEMKDKLKDEGLNHREVNKKVMKALRKAKRILFKEKLYEKKYEMMQKGEFTGPTKVRNKKVKKENVDNKTEVGKKTESNEKNSKKDKKTKDKVKKSSEENNVEDLDLNYELDDLGSDAEIEADEDSIDDNKSENEDRSLNEEGKCSSDEAYVSEDENDKEENMEVVEEQKKDEKSSKEIKVPAIKYEENNMMTCVQGFWIRRSIVGRIDRMQSVKIGEIKSQRKNSDMDSPLNKEEDLQLKVYMRKELHKFANQLRSHLQKRLKKQALNPPKIQKPKKEKTNKQRNKQNWRHNSLPANNSSERRFGQNSQSSGGFSRRTYSDNYNSSNNYQNKFNNSSNSKFGNSYNKKYDSSVGEELVRFDGYFIKKDAAERLKKLKAELIAEGATKEIIAEKMKQERRRAENDLKHERKTVCFSCRKPGHVIADCPLKSNTSGVGACFTCGSLEHQSGNCTESKGGQQFKFATCFICREKGHITINCPRNDKGIYPKGGACTLCDSKLHLIKDCPRNTEREQKELTVGLRKHGEALETMDDEEVSVPKEKKVKKSKKVVF